MKFPSRATGCARRVSRSARSATHDGSPSSTIAWALGVSVLLDDLPYVLRDIAGSSVQAVLLETPYNRAQELPGGTQTVADWPAFIELCTRLAGQRQPLTV